MNFIQSFTAARKVGTPYVAVRTPDAQSTIANIRKSLDEQHKLNPKRLDAAHTPLTTWDGIHGLRGINDKGNEKVAAMLTASGQEAGATVDLAFSLGVLEFAKDDDLIVFLHNPQLYWKDAPNVIQGVINLRDPYKANGNMLVLLIGPGDVLPTEWQSDMLLLEEPLPTREQIGTIIAEVFDFAKAGKPASDVVVAGTDAMIGLPSFPIEQAVAMELDKDKKQLNVSGLWERKRNIIGSMPGLKFHTGNETLADCYGVASIKSFGKALMSGKARPNLLLRVDEIEKQFAGNATDSSGVKGDLLGEFLTWVNDRQIICSLFLGVPGSSKSWFTYCLGGEYGKPVLDYSMSAMQDSLVGNSGKNMRNANRAVESISDGNVYLCATANSLRGLPPELISRFQIGGIWFFDAPDAEERAGIMNLKIEKYHLDSSQEIPAMDGWTGRDIENCARKADLLGISLTEAAKFVVPLLKSHHEEMDALRQSANNRFLSASNPGEYQYKKTSIIHAPVVEPGRKMR